MVVAAFDLGTAFSGYAYAYRDNPKVVYVKENWNSGSALSSKTPTCILLNPDKEFHAFGYEAEKKFADLSENDEHQDWILFRRFKMLLHDREVTYLI